MPRQNPRPAATCLPETIAVHPVRRPSWHWGLGRELGLAFWAMFFVEAAFGSYNNIWPIYIASLGAPVAIVGLIVGASGILRLGVMPPSAWLADRFGSRTILVGARLIAFVGYLWASLAPHWQFLIPAVVALGIGEIAFPQIQAHVASHSSGNPTRIFAIIFVVGPGVALGIGPLLSSAAISAFGLRGAIFLTAMLTLASVACFAGLRHLAPPLRHTDHPEETATSRSSYRTALADVNVRRIVLLQGMTIFSLGLGVTLLPYYLEQTRGISGERIAQFGAIQAIGTVTFGIAVSRLGWLQRNPFFGAAIATALVFTALLIFTTTDSIPLLIIGFVFRGCLFSAWTLFSSSMGTTARPADRARGFAMIELVGGTALSVAPILAGQLYALGPRVPLVASMALALVVVPTLLWSQRRAGRDRMEPTAGSAQVRTDAATP